jgi:hypothetical protein
LKNKRQPGVNANFSTKTRSAEEFEQMALPLSDSERKASRRQLDQLHPGNRFRLMFGQPLLPQDGQRDLTSSSVKAQHQLF